jgi:hypothetical protein
VIEHGRQGKKRGEGRQTLSPKYPEQNGLDVWLKKQKNKYSDQTSPMANVDNL